MQETMWCNSAETDEEKEDRAVARMSMLARDGKERSLFDYNLLLLGDDGLSGASERW